jgi:hypothetical protein
MEPPDFASYLLPLVWSLLSLTNVAMISKPFALVFPTMVALENIVQLCPLHFADGLWDVLHAATPPSIQFFKSLPMLSLAKKFWAVYILVLEKAGCNARTYIGSGTCAVSGYERRNKAYAKFAKDRKRDSQIPDRVYKSVVEDGYEITHHGLLVWTPLPTAANRFVCRCLMLALEAIFAMVFWTMNSKKKDWLMPPLCPWSRESFTYDGLCTHFSINEGVPGSTQWKAEQNLSHKEIDKADKARKLAKSRRHMASRGEGVHNANGRRYRKQNLASHRFKCVPCTKTFGSAAVLRKHEDSKSHKDRVEHRSPRSRPNARKKNWCETCKWGAPSAKRLETHLKSAGHAKKLRVLAELKAFAEQAA